MYGCNPNRGINKNNHTTKLAKRPIYINKIGEKFNIFPIVIANAYAKYGTGE